MTTKRLSIAVLVATIGISLSLTPVLANGALYDQFRIPYTFTQDGQTSPDGNWFNNFGGFGQKGTIVQGSNGFFYEYPQISTMPDEHHTTLTTSTSTFKDFTMTLFMKTVQQLRQNSPPNTYETAWVFWHWTDNFHNYALVLKTNGFQIEKKDNNVQCDCEIFLQTLPLPTVHLGQWQKVKLKVSGSDTLTPRIQVWVDNVLVTDFIDNSIGQPNSAILSTGHMGLYDEDSLVNFDDVFITSAPH